jgi:signal transduction histidine kinase
MRLSLRVKLILAFSIVAITAVLGIVLFANLESERQVRTYMARGGQFGLTSLVEALELHYETQGSWDGVDSVFTNSNFRSGRSNQRGQNMGMQLLNVKQVIVWSSNPTEVGAALDESALSEAIQLVNDRDDRIGYLMVDGSFLIQVDEISPFVTRLKSVVLYSGIAAAVLAVLLAVLLSNYLLKPVKALTKASNQMSSGDLSTRVKVKGNDELTDLASTFNRMATNLELAEDRKKAMTADVAHELRTPIAVQKAQLEGMLDGVIPATSENLGIALQQTDFLSRLVDDLRLLAMADAGEIQLEARETDVQRLIVQLAAQFASQLQADGTLLITEFTGLNGSEKIMLDSDRLTQILHNLLSNAQRYGRRGGEIHLTVSLDPSTLTISVKDDGPGLPESAVPHLFERFYRHEKARSRETGGTGLGLAISRKLAFLMGGELSAGNHPEGGAVFTLSLPIRRIYS